MLRFLLFFVVLLGGFGWIPEAMAHEGGCPDEVLAVAVPDISVVMVVKQMEPSALPCDDCPENCPHMAHKNGGCCQGSSCAPLVSLPEGVRVASVPPHGLRRWSGQGFVPLVTVFGLERPPKVLS